MMRRKQIRRLMILCFCLILASVAGVPVAAGIPVQKFMYTHQTVTLYQTPTEKGKRMMSIQPQRIEVLEQNGAWYRIKTSLGPGWFYDRPGYVTKIPGVQRIRIFKDTPTYKEPGTGAKPIGKWTRVPVETIAVAAVKGWYRVDMGGTYVWINGTGGTVKPIATTYMPKKTAQNGYIGNTTFMTEAAKTPVNTLKQRMVTSMRGEKEWLFEAFILRPLRYGGYHNPAFHHTIGGADQGRGALSAYLDCAFAPGQEIEILNAAAQQAAQEMEEPAHKIAVILGLPYPKGNSTMASARLELEKWYINEAIVRWQQMNPSALRLAGFYWTEEIVPDEDIAFVRGVNTAVHQLGYKSYWAPYYSAQNTEKWNSLGFDFAWLQPNYYFKEKQAYYRGEDMIGQSFTIARETGAGTMLEWSWNVRQVPENTKYLNAYLERGQRMGANRASILVYDGEGGIDVTFSTRKTDAFTPIQSRFFDYLLAK